MGNISAQWDDTPGAHGVHLSRGSWTSLLLGGPAPGPASVLERHRELIPAGLPFPNRGPERETAKIHLIGDGAVL